MFRNRWTYLGIGIVAVFLILALFAPLIATHNPMAINLREAMSSPSFDHFLGQDVNGSDVFSRIVYGARISLFTGFTVVLISGIIGIFIGLVSGFYGGWVDTVLMRIVDVLLAFPGILLAIAIVAVMGPRIINVVIALSVLGWVSFARLVRGQVISVKEREFVLAAKTSGQSDLRIMFVHILPNILSPVIVQATFSIAGVIIAESSLSFLGLGAPPGTPSWGLMLSEGTKELLDAPYLSIYPGTAIMLVVIAFNFIGDGLRDMFDPKSERR